MHDNLNIMLNALNERIGFTVNNITEESIGIPFIYNENRFYFIDFADKATCFPFILAIENNEILPHLLEEEYDLNGEKVRILCLLNKENYIASHITYQSKVNLILDQFERLMNLTPKQIVIEMQKEFMYYWDYSSKNLEKYKLHVPSSSEAHELDVIYVKDPNDTKKTLEIVIKDQNTTINTHYLKRGVHGKALFIPIIDSRGISPPHKSFLWGKKELLRIIENPIFNNISSETYKYLKKYRHKGNKLLIVFSMKVPGGFNIMYLAKLEFENGRNYNLINKITDYLNQVTPLYSVRYDKVFMKSRIGMNNLTDNISVLIAGTGSLGSYIARELPKLGITKMTLVDSDKYNTGNCFRHTLPASFNSWYKVTALKFELERHYPNLEIYNYEEQFNPTFIDKNNVNDIDLIIISIGSTDSQLEINKKLNDVCYKGKVIYTWLEPLGIGAHALLVDYEKQGCYNCLFYDDEGTIINNKASLIEANDNLLIDNGCGGSFTAYGNIVLLEATSQVVSIITKLLIGDKFNNNVLYSRKTEINNSEVLFTQRYHSIKIQCDDDKFMSKGCEICANRH